ncbi:MAG: hypothetical protein GY845_25695 [Planctomycetes bacterium]|nr:hypothetical protein [Planctomycetota bacterium]
MHYELDEKTQKIIIGDCEPIDVDEQYDELLDEIYPEYSIGGITFNASRILKELDRIAYDTGLSEYFDNDENYVEVDGDYYNLHEVNYALKEHNLPEIE